MIDNIKHIIEGCRRKDSIAQQKLYEEYSGCMFGVCLRYSGSKQDAEDILHEGFLKIFEKIGQFKSLGSFVGWMRKIMVNTALERYRNKYRLVRLDDDNTGFEQVSHEDLTDNITAKELMIFVQDLSPQYRLVFNMFAIEGYSHKEISKSLKISEGTSKSNLSRARAILQEKVKIHYNQIERERRVL